MAVALSVSLASGCGFFTSRPDILPPAGKLLEEAERDLDRKRYETARDSLRKIVERHPDSDLVPTARLLIGETYYRDEKYDQAVREFETFVTIYPSHKIADLAQYRLARSYFDQMPVLERDQGAARRAVTEFQRLIKQYPESRYAPDAIVRMEACRLRLAQKEIWVAEYYVRQGQLQAALQRYEVVLKEFRRTSAAPQALFQQADLFVRLGRTDDALAALGQLVAQFPDSEWGRRARDRQAQLDPARTSSQTRP